MGGLGRLASSRLISSTGAEWGFRKGRWLLARAAEDVARSTLTRVSSERTALFGSGDGGALALLFAATYPERTTALVLFSVQPRWRWAPDYPWGMRPEEAERLIEEGERGFDDPET